MPALPGFRDFLPQDIAKQSHLFAKFREAANAFGFQEYAGPPLETLELYTKKSGPEIVSQLYNFKDKGDREIALRPELTPSFARIVAENQRQFKKPLKWFSIPQLFRYERQQKGRLREHFQFNADIVGTSGTGTDAEIIALLSQTLNSCGLDAQKYVIRVSHRGIWLDFLQKMGISSEFTLKILGIIDKVERTPVERIRQQLAECSLTQEQIDSLLALPEVKNIPDLPDSPHKDYLAELFKDLAYLGAANTVQVDFKIVRGLAYYTGVVFEAFAIDEQGRPTGRALAGGGRYDDLIKHLTGTDLPAAGFGMGDVVLSDLLDELNLWPTNQSCRRIFIAWAADTLRPSALSAATLLRKLPGVEVEYSLKAMPLNKQLQQAAERSAQLVIIAQDEQNFEIRDFSSDKSSQKSLSVVKNDLHELVSSLF